MDDKQARITALLMREYLFQGLSRDELLNVADKFKAFSIDAGEAAVEEGLSGKSFFIIYKGKMKVTQKRGRRERVLNTLGPGDFFGEEALLFDRPRSASVTALERSTLLRLDREDFDELLQRYPTIRVNLSATAGSRRLARYVHFDWLAPDEVVYLICRKHLFFLLRALVLPILLGIGSIPVMSLALADWNALEGFIGGVMFLLATGWFLWSLVDWSNDYYIVTSQRVVWQEKIVALWDSRREAPLNSVMATDVTTSLVGRWLGYGNVAVRTFTGSLVMRNSERPYLFASFVDGYRSLAQLRSREREIELFEQDLDKAMRDSMAGENIEPAIPLKPRSPLPPKATRPKKTTFREWLRTFLKVRYEENGVITYRKHWFILLTKSWAPLLAVTGLTGLAIYLIRSGNFNLIVWALYVLLYLGAWGWLIYQYLDWSNDIYRITPTQIMDIERKPLGREQKKTSNLDAPDFRVEHIRPNLLGILLNFGTVNVSVGQTVFDFVGVYNPDQVHQDIADYREGVIRRKREDEARRERTQTIERLLVFDRVNDRLTHPERGSDDDEF